MTTETRRGRCPRGLPSLLGRLSSAGVGFGGYQLIEPHVRIQLQEQVSPTMFALAGVIGVLAGFTATAVVFIAAANGPGIEEIRRNHGQLLTSALLSAVVMLLASAVGLVICGLFANGWGAKGTACALMVAPVYDVALVLLALRTAINSSATKPTREVQPESEV
jgi:hypothetical protein